MNIKDVTVIIPSYNRPEYALKCLKYWSNFKINVHFVDGSEKALNLEDVKKIISKSNVEYHHINILSEVDRIRKILPQINTRYAMLSSDDDLLLPNAISKCMNELNKDKNLISCYGQTISFYKVDNKIKFNLSDKRLKNFKNLSDNPVQRLNYHMSNYVPSIIYSLMLTNFFKKIFDVEDFKQFKFYSSLELRASLLINFLGKSKVIKDVLVLRNKMESPAVRRTRKNTSLLMTMFAPNVKDTRINFLNGLVKSVKNVDDKKNDYLYKIFADALRKYLFFTLKRFFFKKIILMIINNVPFLFKKRKQAKINKMFNFSELNEFCDSEGIDIDQFDFDLIKKELKVTE